MMQADSTFSVLWLQSGGCGGCSMSLLCAESPDLYSWMQGFSIQLLWHPSLSDQADTSLFDIYERICQGELRLDALCLEGSILRGPNGSGRFHQLRENQSMADFVHQLASHAAYTLAIGNCAAYGGITAAGVNPTDACGLQYEYEAPGGLLGEQYRSDAGWPVINIAGCPVHPDWVRETLLGLSLGQLTISDLDNLGRPRLYSDHLVHHGCPRNEYYEFKASAEKPGQLGCLMENLGCVGTQAHADCNTRTWNGSGSCIRGGYACINCTMPGFEEPGHSFLSTPKVAGIPVGLPADMPKAWFVALAALSKSATPSRVRTNAREQQQVVAPAIRNTKK